MTRKVHMADEEVRKIRNNNKLSPEGMKEIQNRGFDILSMNKLDDTTQKHTLNEKAKVLAPVVVQCLQWIL